MALTTNPYYDFVAEAVRDFDSHLGKALNAESFLNAGFPKPNRRYFRLTFFEDAFVEEYIEGRVLEETYLFEYWMQRTYPIPDEGYFTQADLNYLAISESGKLKNAIGEAYIKTNVNAQAKLKSHSIGQGRTVGWSSPVDKNSQMLILTVVGQMSLSFATVYNVETCQTDLNPNYIL